MFRKAVIAAIVASATAVSPDLLAANLYKVSATATHKGVSFAAPEVVIEEGVAADVEVTGPDGYKLSLIVTEAGAEKFKVVTRLDSAHGTMSPIIIVKAGQAAAVSVGEMGLNLSVDRVGSRRFMQTEAE